MSQPRYNPKTQRDDWYYRIKESFRDLTGRVRSRVMLNVGFIDEPHRPEDTRDIGKYLTYLHEHQGEKDLFGNPLSRYNGFVQRKTQEFWQEMVNNGSIDAVKTTMEESRKKAERLVDVNTIQHTVCLDAGIATEENLQKIKEKGYNYLCVSRRRLTDYEIAPDAKTVTVLDSKRQPIKFTQVKHEEDGDYYLEINSLAKQLKETSMNRKFKERFEEELQKAKESLTKKN